MYQVFKRIADFSFAALLLLFSAPLMLVIAAMVRATAGRPVLFRQRRPGLNERSFTCLKFRTMTDGRQPDGRPLPDEMRVTRFGRFLRRTSLDELPQLWNILRGDLSFVGPRPLLEDYLPYYSPEEHRRHSVPPGLTGWAQINGRNCVSIEERLARDVWYVDRVTFALDMKILAYTIWLVVTQKGIDPDPRTGPGRLDVLRLSAASQRSGE